MEWLDIEKLTALLGDAAASQVLHYGGFFTLAAYIHGRQVKIEIRNQFTLLNAAIDRLTEALVGHATRLDNVERDVRIIKDKLGIPISETQGEKR